MHYTQVFSAFLKIKLLVHFFLLQVNLLSIYDKSDLYAIGSMFYNILLPTEVDWKFQELKERNPTYTTQEIPELPVQLSRGIKVLLRNLVCSSPSDRLDEQTAKLL